MTIVGAVIALFTPGNTSPGKRENRGKRRGLAEFGVPGRPVDR